MAINDERIDFLRPDSMVEVRSNKSGFQGAWYAAKILKSYSNPQAKFMVEFQNSSNQQMKEVVDISLIRPLPPPPAADQSYEVNDVVDALCGNGWWKGVVSKVEFCGRYKVVFENPPQQFHFSPKNLRIHLDWTDGTWVRPPKHQEAPNREDSGKLIDITVTYCSGSEFPWGKGNNSIPKRQEAGPENTMEESSKKNRSELSAQVSGQHVDNTANHSEEVPETEETLSNHGKTFINENSAISLTPSGKSTEQLIDITLTYCSDLPWDKGDNSIPKRQEAGPENTIEESSERNRTEPSAQVTGQNVNNTANHFKEVHEAEETLSNHGKAFRKEKSPISLTPSRKSTEQLTDITLTYCSDLPWDKGNNSSPKRQDAGPENTIEESSDNRMSAQVTGQKVTAEPNTEDCGKQSAHVDNSAYHSKEVPETGETLPNHGKTIRKENSVISLTLLEKSTEQLVDITVTNCSTSDSGANLALDKGKNSSPSGQGVGPENRVEESSKKRERELNAQVTGQKAAAAPNREDCGKQSVHVNNTVNEVPETEDTLPYHGETFRKENSAISLSASGKSTEQVINSKLANCSKCDSGANLALDKGKNSSPCRQEVGPENRMAMSSKKRGRELNAQVSGPKVVAAPNRDDHGEQSAHVDNTANHSKEVPETEVLSNHAKKSRKENSVISVTPSVLRKSIEQDSTVVDFLMCDPGANLPSSKGKNSEVPNREDCEKQSAHVVNAANHSKQVPETEETLSNHANKFRKENSVISSTSVLRNSREQVIDSITNCSASNSGENLPLNKGKYTCLSQQEAGPENRMEESSKKRGRELNARVTGQKVATAGDREKAEVLTEKSKSRRYTVFVEIPPDKFEFSSSNMKFHLVWNDGRWVRPPIEEIQNTAGCEKQSADDDNAANHSKVVPETEETLSNHAQKLREENSVISLTPSVLMNSTEEVPESTPAECSTSDSGGNLPLKKRKHISPNHQEAGPENRLEESSSENRERELNAQVTAHCFPAAEEEEEEQSAHVSRKDSSTEDAHGEEQSSAKKLRKNLLEDSTSPSSSPRSTSKKQKIPAPEIEETLPNYSKKSRSKNRTNILSPDECCATSMLKNSSKQVTDSSINKGTTIDTSRNLQLVGSNSLNKGKNSVLPNRTHCEEQSAHVSFTADNHCEGESAVEMLRKNPLEQSTSHSTTSTRKKQKMVPPESEEETLPNYTNRLRTENSVNLLSPDECRATSMLINLAEQVIDTAATNCSMLDKSGDGMVESSKKRRRDRKAQITSQTVLAAAGEDGTNEDPAEVVNERNAETANQSSTVDGQVESEVMGDTDPPFRKSSYMWKVFDSLEVFRILPQNPHFSFLADCNEETREGSAVGHMLTFASLVEKVTKLQIEDPRSVFDRYLEALAILEEIGFDVKVVVDRVNELLILKRNRKQLLNRLKRYENSIAKCEEKKAKLEEEISAIDEMMNEDLVKQRALKVSRMTKEDSKRDSLQLEVPFIKSAMLDVEHKFKVKSSAPWERNI
ncbi:protein of unknown function 724 7 [Euphorbia peplus]|nr:protein of unknown function 724 7 [Euphorbia peplus]